MKRLSPLRPLILPAVLLILFAALAINYRLLNWFDESVISLVRTLPNSLTPLMERISWFGNFREDIALIVIIAIWELVRRNYNRAFVAIATLTAFPLFFVVKETVSRARPSVGMIIDRGLPGYSFPSGHAVTSAAAFGLLAILAYSHLPKPWRSIALGACLVFIFLIGISRVYLGAHYPTDVIGGWLLALTVLSALRSISIYIGKRTHEKVSETTEAPESAN